MDTKVYQSSISKDVGKVFPLTARGACCLMYNVVDFKMLRIKCIVYRPLWVVAINLP